MEFITEINPAVAIALGTFVMGTVQAIKPFIADRFVVLVVLLLSTVLGIILAVSASLPGWPQTIVQAVIYTGLLVGTSSGAYSIAKSGNQENPAGIK